MMNCKRFFIVTTILALMGGTYWLLHPAHVRVGSKRIQLDRSVMAVLIDNAIGRPR